MRHAGLALLCLLMYPASVRADAATPVPATRVDTYVERLQQLTLLETLNAELLSHDSATATLERWCAAHHLASPPRVMAERVATEDKPPSPVQRQDLEVMPAELVRYRRVRLVCGTVVLSEAENWYVPGRLSTQMNRLLETTDTPFGKVVQSLQYRRHTLSARLLWHPLPEGWETGSLAANADIPIAAAPVGVIEHRAVLSLPDATPISEVVETYSRHVLDFPLPQP
jgi:chorismate-pyruvate lyase